MCHKTKPNQTKLFINNPVAFNQTTDYFMFISTYQSIFTIWLSPVYLGLNSYSL